MQGQERRHKGDSLGLSGGLVGALAEAVEKLGPVVIERGNALWLARPTRNPRIYMLVRRLGPLDPEYYSELHRVMVEHSTQERPVLGILVTAEGIYMVVDAWSSSGRTFVKIEKPEASEKSKE